MTFLADNITPIPRSAYSIVVWSVGFALGHLTPPKSGTEIIAPWTICRSLRTYGECSASSAPRGQRQLSTAAEELAYFSRYEGLEP